MSDTTTPPVRYTGPGSPQDVPPVPGSFGVDPGHPARPDPRGTAGA
jgi:hypothetical protein